MKIQDIPQTGKMGLTVTWPGGNGLIRRILVTPANPRTDRQLEVRDLLSQQARRFPPHLFGTGCSSPVEISPDETILFKRSGLKYSLNQHGFQR